jgi:hypothetical protein
LVITTKSICLRLYYKLLRPFKLKCFNSRFGEKMVEVKKENEKRTTVFIDRPGKKFSSLGFYKSFSLLSKSSDIAFKAVSFIGFRISSQTGFYCFKGGAKAQYNRAQQFVRKPVMNSASRINHKESTRVEQSLKPALSAPTTKTMSPRYQSPSDPARNESSLERSQISKPTAASQKHLHHNSEIMKRPLR